MLKQKVLILLRGVPGSGKSTLAKLLSEKGLYPVFSIDDYFVDPITLEYKFDYTKNHLAYSKCQLQTEDAMKKATEKIFVDNTFVFEWEIKPYFEMAQTYNYIVFSIVVENNHGTKNSHHISDEDVLKMAAKFKVKLI